jgi:hypothetical protein
VIERTRREIAMVERKPRANHTGHRAAPPRRGRATKADRIGMVHRPTALRRLRAAIRANLDRPDPDEPQWREPAEDEEIAEQAAASPVEQAASDGDGLPEYTIYRDDGCHVAPACLSCPLAACIYDHKLSQVRQKRRQRNNRIRALARGGWSSARLAEQFSLSAAQVRRIRGPRRKRGV